MNAAGLKLNLGCGGKVVAGWVNVDCALGARLARIPAVGPLCRALHLFNLTWDRRIFIHDLRRPFPWRDGAADVAYSSHLLEHLTRSEGRLFLEECRRVLKPGGLLRIVVPDLAAIVVRYASGRLPAERFVDELGLPHRNGNGRGLRRRLAGCINYPHACMYDGPALLRVTGDVGFRASARRYLESDIPGIEDVETEERTRGAVVIEGRR